MSQRKIYVFTIFIIFLFIINSCVNSADDQVATKGKTVNTIFSDINPIYDREVELIEVLNHYDVPTDIATIVLMPPTKCAACKLGALRMLDTMQNIYVLAADTTIYIAKNNTQKLIYYDSELINRKGLVKLYSAILTIKNNKVIANNALTN